MTKVARVHSQFAVIIQSCHQHDEEVELIAVILLGDVSKGHSNQHMKQRQLQKKCRRGNVTIKASSRTIMMLIRALRN